MQEEALEQCDAATMSAEAFDLCFEEVSFEFLNGDGTSAEGDSGTGKGRGRGRGGRGRGRRLSIEGVVTDVANELLNSTSGEQDIISRRNVKARPPSEERRQTCRDECGHEWCVVVDIFIRDNISQTEVFDIINDPAFDEEVDKRMIVSCPHWPY